MSLDMPLDMSLDMSLDMFPWYVPWCFSRKILHPYSHLPMRAIRPANSILLDLITVSILGQELGSDSSYFTVMTFPSVLHTSFWRQTKRTSLAQKLHSTTALSPFIPLSFHIFLSILKFRAPCGRSSPVRPGRWGRLACLKSCAMMRTDSMAVGSGDHVNLRGAMKRGKTGGES
jgi:hypothetical protein